jgi:hypothetical protein
MSLGYAQNRKIGKPNNLKVLRSNTTKGDKQDSQNLPWTHTAIAVRYDKTSNILTGWAYPETWELLGVSLLAAETQTR